MTFHESIRNSRRVLVLRGDFDVFVVRSFLRRIDLIVASGCRDLTLDLGGVPFLGARGVSALLAARETLEARGGALHLTGLDDLARWTLATCGVDQHLLGDTQRAA